MKNEQAIKHGYSVLFSNTFESLSKTYGAKNFNVIGDDVRIDDERVYDRIKLRPTLLYPDTFIEYVLDAYEEAESPAEKTRLQKSFMFLTEDIDPSKVSPRVKTARDTFTTLRTEGI